MPKLLWPFIKYKISPRIVILIVQKVYFSQFMPAWSKTLVTGIDFLKYFYNQN